MKTLKDLDAKPEPMQEDTPAEIIATFPTYRKLMKSAVGTTVAKSGEEAIDLVQLGLKLKIDGDVSIEDAEFKLLKEKCEANPMKWESHYHGQILLKLREAEGK